MPLTTSTTFKNGHCIQCSSFRALVKIFVHSTNIYSLIAKSRSCYECGPLLHSLVWTQIPQVGYVTLELKYTAIHWTICSSYHFCNRVWLVTNTRLDILWFSVSLSHLHYLMCTCTFMFYGWLRWNKLKYTIESDLEIKRELIQAMVSEV